MNEDNISIEAIFALYLQVERQRAESDHLRALAEQTRAVALQQVVSQGMEFARPYLDNLGLGRAAAGRKK